MSDDQTKPEPGKEAPKKQEPSVETPAPESAAAIFPEIRDIVETSGLSTEKKDALFGRLTAVIVERHFSGPLPHPEVLQGYAALIDNGANRIMLMTENQSSHRITQENRVILHEIINTYIGQILAFIISMAFLYAAYNLGMAGHDLLAGTLGGATLLGLGTAFILGRKKQEGDLEAKRPPGPPDHRKGPSKNKKLKGR